MECGLAPSQGKRQSYGHRCWPSSQRPGRIDHSVPNRLERETAPEARNVCKHCNPGAEGACFEAAALNPLEFVSSKCVFPALRVSHWVLVPASPHTINVLVGKMHPGSTAGAGMS